MSVFGDHGSDVRRLQGHLVVVISLRDTVKLADFLSSAQWE